LREKNIFQIITDTLPDEIDDSINDINYRYWRSKLWFDLFSW
jgi:hypothetical protein